DVFVDTGTIRPRWALLNGGASPRRASLHGDTGDAPDPAGRGADLWATAGTAAPPGARFPADCLPRSAAGPRRATASAAVHRAAPPARGPESGWPARTGRRRARGRVRPYPAGPGR